jgi:hypothetical protein
MAEHVSPLTTVYVCAHPPLGVEPGDVVVEVGGVEVGPEAVEERTGVPVSHAMDPPQAAPGSGVPLHVQEDYRR